MEWSETSSNEPSGWYLCSVLTYYSDGKAELMYKNGDRERIDLTTVRWHLTRKSSKAYLPFSTTPQQYPLKKMRAQLDEEKFVDSIQHKAKAYVDDLTFISSDKTDHQDGLTGIHSKCESLDLHIRPEKCYSLHMENGKVKPSSFTISESVTKCVKSNPMKFLGQFVASSNKSTCHLSVTSLSTLVNDTLQRINDCPVRGDYKIWIYRNYLVPSIYFQLSVNKFSKSFISKLQGKVTKYLKQWLRLPRCSTLAILFHPDVLKLPYIPHTPGCLVWLSPGGESQTKLPVNYHLHIGPGHF